MDIGIFYTIFTTVFLLILFGYYLFVESYYLGGDYYVYGNYARKKTILEKFFDGFKILLKI